MSFDVISILAGGYSAKNYNLNKLPGKIIAVNGSALYAPKFDFIVSMDRLFTENSWDYILKAKRPSYLRRAALIRVVRPLPTWVNVFECDYKSAVMSDDPGILNGTNSGLCAVNLAYQLRPSHVRLYGMDLAVGPRGEGHWYEDYNWHKKNTSAGKLSEWRNHLHIAIDQFKKVGINVEIMK